MGRKTRSFGIVVGFLLLCAGVALAVPASLNYQGSLKDASGDPLNGSVAMEFRIFDAATDGNLVWGEKHDSVAVTQGIFDVRLGTGVQTVPPSPQPIDAAMFDNPDLWLEIAVEGEILAPRQKLTAVAFAMRAAIGEGVPDGSLTGAAIADGSLTGAELQDGTISVNKFGTESCSLGDTLVQTATGWECRRAVPLLPGSIVDCYDGPIATLDLGPCKRGTRSDAGICEGQVVPQVESCDGSDNDCDGGTDNNLTPPLNPKQDNICFGTTQFCSGPGGWIIDYSAVPNYEDPEVTCDGIDNDCSGAADDALTVPLNPKQADICSGSTQVCAGPGGWVVTYSSVAGYEDPEVTCDGIDNDCDGVADDNLSGPLNPNQTGACLGSTQACSGSGGWEENYSRVVGFESHEITCDSVDNDCDGYVDLMCTNINWTWVGGHNGGVGAYGAKGIGDPRNVPGEKYGSVSWTDTVGNRWLFGGYGPDSAGTVGASNDLWRFDGANWAWVSGSDVVNQPGVYGAKGFTDPVNVPGGRYYSVSWMDTAGNLWLFGGLGFDIAGTYGFLNDLWKFDGVNWTWISGSAVADQLGAYGPKGIADSGNVPGARYGSVSWADTAGNLWLFGGYGPDSSGTVGALNDLWRFDGVNWTWVSGSAVADQFGVYGPKGIADSGNVPGARADAVSWTDAAGNLWLFGGSGYASSGTLGILNDLWKYDGVNWTWVSGSAVADQLGAYGPKGIADSGNVPGARYGSVSWADTAGNLWLFGGVGYASSGIYGYLNDLWKFDGVNWTWVSGSDVGNQPGVYGTKGIADPSNVPGARADSVSWTDAVGNLWLFSGAGYVVNNLWRYDGVNWTWISGDGPRITVHGSKGVADSGNGPMGRHQSISWTDTAGNLWLFGGYGWDSSFVSNGDLNDLWKFDGVNWTWVSGSDAKNQPGVYGTKGIADPGNVPGGRYGSMSWTDTAGNLWLLGGIGYDTAGNSGYLNDLWRFDGVNWTWMSGSDVRNQTGVYGTKGVADSGDVPGARYAAVSWTDTAGNLLLFGGSGYASSGTVGALNDLWRFDGVNWAWISGSDVVGQPGVYGTKGVADSDNVPGARSESVSWTDIAGNLWLFGGSYRNDLWRFDGVNWTWISGSDVAGQPGVYGTKGIADPNNVPGGRYGSVSWMDTAGNPWLFGGVGYDTAGNSGYLNDLWRFDGVNWTWMSGSDVRNQPGVYGAKGVEGPGNVPGARYQSVSWADIAGNLWLFGGTGLNALATNVDPMDDLWRFDIAYGDYDGDGVFDWQDCDPLDATRGIPEVCDGVDNNCDGVVDEGCACNFLGDMDGVCSSGSINAVSGLCDAPGSYEAIEGSCDGLDNDCNGTADDGLTPPLTMMQSGVCSGATETCGGGAGWLDDYSGVANYEATETSCDGLNNDCDAVTDEGCQCNYLGDTDGVCSSGTIHANIQICMAPATYESPESSCDGLDNDCDGNVDNNLFAPLCPLLFGVCSGSRMTCGGAAGWLACTAAEYGPNYEAVETSCDGLDNDCDNRVDEGCPCNYLNDPDGVCATATRNSFGTCMMPAVYESSELSCDGLDNDCDGNVDEAPGCPCNFGDDPDGVCATATRNASGICFPAPSGYQITETTCDGVDNDCDGVTDEGCP